MTADATYEDRFGPVSRRLRRVYRLGRWHLHGMLGIRRTILVEIRWRLGDEIMALPMYRALKRRYPGAELVVWCTYPELLAGNDWVDGINADDADPDRYILLRDAARATNRIEHYARVAGVNVPPERPRVRPPEPVAGDWTADPGRRVVIAPGGSWPTKRWPVERWKGVCDRLSEAGVETVVLGNAGEGVGAGRDLTGQTTVSDCMRILAGADLCICSDSGLMHLALAVDTPVVALFGPTNPAILVGDDGRLAAITNARDCRFCWNDSQEMTEPGVCPRQIAECLGTIEVEAVVEQIGRALGIEYEDTPTRP